MKASAVALALSCAITALPALANPAPNATQGVWAAGLTARAQTSPYISESARADFLPELYYQGEQWYLAGTRAGWKREINDGLMLDAFSRYRFGGYTEDQASELDGMRRTGTLEAGVELSQPTAVGEWRIGASADTLNRHQGWSAHVEWRTDWQWQDWTLIPSVAVEYDNAEVNDYFYGVRSAEAQPDRPAYEADASTQLRFGIEAWTRLGRSHLLGLGVSHTRLSDTIADSPIVDSDQRTELSLNYRYEFINNPAAQAINSASDSAWLKGEWEWRVAGGYWTDGNFIEMIYLNNMAVDTRNTAMVSAFLSKKINDEAWNMPVDVHITGGLVRHFERGEKDDFNEYVIALKGYYNRFPWSHIVETRVGFGYGFSYGEQVPWQERDNVMRKNLNDSRILQYLDYSWDVNVGDLFNSPSAKHCYVGYSIHHRSGIFGQSDAYHRVDGGSNWNTFYLQCKTR
ncbi:MipA/OmpV family protein [Simiduia aestuariiviva]|uniref:Outer membrane protein n=1 Tax=Simiduia aestuariiviva TaxID=1510459 RepID=A0A839UVK7_9GAMM|nr:MipA/OmpV family protein [Simiduia aestuariiviva]MBB3169397.1 outer membrane protein [Simiduia aestuariiviva]